MHATFETDYSGLIFITGIERSGYRCQRVNLQGIICIILEANGEGF